MNQPLLVIDIGKSVNVSTICDLFFSKTNFPQKMTKNFRLNKLGKSLAGSFETLHRPVGKYTRQPRLMRLRRMFIYQKVFII
jgi:hypothetical protein